jgi:hypothetical protein
VRFARTLAFLASLLALQPELVTAEERACPPRPCDLKKEGRAACAAKATWVLEGRVSGIADKFAKDCTRFGDLVECMPPGWMAATVDLEKLNAIKMPISVVIDGPPIFSGYGKASLTPANRCWEDTARLPGYVVGRRVRFYGMDKYQNLPAQMHGWQPYRSGNGYFAYEVLD